MKIVSVLDYINKNDVTKYDVLYSNGTRKTYTFGRIPNTVIKFIETAADYEKCMVNGHGAFFSYNSKDEVLTARALQEVKTR